MKKLFAIILLSLSLPAYAQPYMEKITSERFAQAVFGGSIDYTMLNDDFTFFIAGGKELTAKPGGGLTPGITFFSGLHFWGYTEFFVRYQAPVRLKASFVSDSLRLDYHGKYLPGVQTGLKIYPLRLRNKHFTPMIGMSWNLPEYHSAIKVNDEERELASAFRFETPLTGGISYMNEKLIIDLSYTHYWQPLNVPIAGLSKEQLMIYRKDQRVAQGSIGLGVRFWFDSSVGIEETRDKLEKRDEKLKELGRLNGFTYGIGLSSIHFLKSSPMLESSEEGFSKLPPSTVFPEVSFGYHVQKLESELRVAYRGLTNSIEQSSFMGDYRLRQEHVSIEAIKILNRLNFHGFIPFVGVGYNRSFIRLSGSSFGEKQQQDGNIPLIFGWDIDVIGHAPFVLRTNLRYNFNRSLQVQRGEFNLDNLEVNFIQAVWFPSRKLKK